MPETPEPAPTYPPFPRSEPEDKAESVYSDLGLLPAVATGAGDTSQQQYIRISADALSEFSTFSQGPEAGKIREICQRFGLARMDDLVGAEKLGTLQKQLGEEAADRRRTQRDLAAEIAARRKAEEDLAAEVTRKEELRRQFVELRDLSVEETARANPSADLLAEMRAVVAHLVKFHHHG